MRGSALLLVMGLAALAPAAAATASVAVCAPPCGYIYPTIILSTDVAGTMDPEGPVEIPMDIVFEWNFDNDGTGLHDPGAPITITFDAPKKPNWIDWAIEPSEIVLQAPQFDPITTYRYEFTATLTLTPDLDLPEDQRIGSKMLFFAQSSESGTYKQSYGVEVFRFPEAGAETDPAGSGENRFAPGAGGILAGAALGVAGMAFAAARRRRQG